MSTNPGSGYFKILSFEGEKATGVNDTDDDPQEVRLGLPLNTWKLEQVDDNTFRFSLGKYPFTGVIEDKVNVSQILNFDRLWHITPWKRGDLDVYTIEFVEDWGKLWTVSPEFSINPHIVIKQIDGEPTKDQLFRLVQVDEE